MLVLITAKGQYLVLNDDKSAFGVFDTLLNAISSIRMQNQIPLFTWDHDEYFLTN